MKSILDPSFHYTTSFNTDLAKTFARVRRDHLRDAEACRQAVAEGFAKVSPITKKTAAEWYGHVLGLDASAEGAEIDL